ncbi:DUF488 domain-containing protein [Kitasatospora viridis]|uniref:Uncharacterized protein YeaO (DUF488 family) n=1 Tax=Kitasatospora viridis TaxID=281105 RepID=A0A561UFK4_9ACTN|nr:DUF488 family protein [Kitasatospora viridis]TWF98125.1 uncharacterized protein YeaO (DUF488 family) [Kitasatospora viridis]
MARPLVEIRLRRVYDPPEPADGYRVLADRLWPRGLAKERAGLDEWAKDLAPSTELRHWLHEAPEQRGAEFAERYRAELDTPAARARLAALRAHPVLTLLTANKDPRARHTAVLGELLRT